MRVTHVITRLIVGGAQENTVNSVLGLRHRPDVDVKLISGPVCLRAPENARVVSINSNDEMYEAVRDAVRDCDVLVMCAAVSDYKPAKYSEQKLKKKSAALSLDLVPTRDILASLTLFSPRAIIVGFAAETQSLEKNALKKLREKNCDLICANDVTRMDTGFDADANELSLFFRDGSRRDFSRAPKRELARELVEICVWLAKKR